jgi:hypothetical protein
MILSCLHYVVYKLKGSLEGIGVSGFALRAGGRRFKLVGSLKTRAALRRISV